VGESITEVQIGDWLVGEGQSAAKDAALVVIETDKVTVELPAPEGGKVTRVLKKKGETASVGEVIGYLESGAAAEAGPTPAKTAPRQTTSAQPTPMPARAAPTGEAAPPTAAPAREREVVVMPAAKRALATEGVDPASVTPSGPGGRMLKEDVQRAAAARQAAAAPSAAEGREEEVVPMTPLRRRIAERLVEAQQTAALLTTFNEIDMSAVLALRGEHKDAFQARHGVKLGFMSFFVKAAIEALKLVPQVNAEVRGDSVVYRNYHDIGVAVGGGKGLVVPVLRDAGRMSFARIEAAIADLAARAQANKLSLEELQGGTFTISNGGIYGSLLSTPIVNPPQSGILGLHAIQDRPVARDGQVVIRPMMYVALTYDHRVVDGREAVTWLKRVKECIEDPARMLLEV
jgi:2-oxoglutarate dehydrogenase E2 component (dihydrolipoamide succinyltransferase)